MAEVSRPGSSRRERHRTLEYESSLVSRCFNPLWISHSRRFSHLVPCLVHHSSFVPLVHHSSLRRAAVQRRAVCLVVIEARRSLLPARLRLDLAANSIVLYLLQYLDILFSVDPYRTHRPGGVCWEKPAERPAGKPVKVCADLSKLTSVQMGELALGSLEFERASQPLTGCPTDLLLLYLT